LWLVPRLASELIHLPDKPAGVFSKAWKNPHEIFQALEKLTAKLSNAWKNHGVEFPIIGKLRRADYARLLAKQGMSNLDQ
jgi:hypothetical protein